MRRLLVLLSAWAGWLHASAQTIDVAPADALAAGVPFTVTLAQLPPDATVTVVAERMLVERGREAAYRSRVRLRSDAAGKVDLARQAPFEGDFQQADPTGPFWSMSPIDAAQAPPVPGGVVRLTVLHDGKVLASRDLALTGPPERVQAQRAEPFPGAVLLRPVTSARVPAIIVLGGSEGGGKSATEIARRLAGQGYAALALPYYSPPAMGQGEREFKELPASFVDIPVDRLDAVRAWLAGQEGIDGERIALYGFSKGAEFALLAAARLRWPVAVVAIAPSDVVWQGWGTAETAPRSSFSFAGAPLPFVPYAGFAKEMEGFRTGADVRYRRPFDQGRAAHPQAVSAARIRVEGFAGALLVAGADDDQMWDSGTMARNIAARRQAAGRETVSLIFPDAGHMLNGTGIEPTGGYNAGPFKLGGTPVANAHAQAAVWRAALAFLQRALRPQTLR